MEEFFPKCENEMLELGRRLVRRFTADSSLPVVYLRGELGAGKTTLVRGMLSELGVTEGVRSPTFTLMQVYETQPPVLHVDLYRVKSYLGLGLEDYLDTHLILIEWPDRAEGLVPTGEAWHVDIDFDDPGRRVRVQAPAG